MYSCHYIDEGENVIAGRFSGDAGMSGSPLLIQAKGSTEWKVLGVYTEGSSGKMSSYFSKLVDHFEAGVPFGPFKFDFSSFTLLE